MDNFGFIVYRPLSCKLATYAKQKKIRFTFPGGASAPPPCPCLRAPMAPAFLLARATGFNTKEAWMWACFETFPITVIAIGVSGLVGGCVQPAWVRRRSQQSRSVRQVTVQEAGCRLSTGRQPRPHGSLICRSLHLLAILNVCVITLSLSLSLSDWLALFCSSTVSVTSRMHPLV